MKRSLLACFAMLSLLVLVAGAVASPAAAAPGGKANGVKACQKGGWETLARSGDAGTPFVSQKECVSYASNGGTLVPYVPVIQRSLSAVTVQTGDPDYCIAHVTGTGFAPNTVYTLYTKAGWDAAFSPFGTVTSDGDGDLDFYGWSYANGAGVTFQAQVDGAESNVVTLNC
jgi:hypothetical protein